jgi:hypothetical protein
MESLPIDEDCHRWTLDEWDMLMSLLGEALVTGPDDGVARGDGERSKARANT